jgi:hypothetical protein
LYFLLSRLCEGWKYSETPPAHAKLLVCAPHATVPLRSFVQAVLVRRRLSAVARGPTLDTLSEREMKTCKADRSRIVGSYGEEVLAIMIRVWKSV